MKNGTSKKHPARRGRATAWPVGYRWIAVGTFMVYTVLGARTVHAAAAQDADRPKYHPHNDHHRQSLPVRRFEIVAGPLDTVLHSFEHATDLHVVVSNQAIRNLASPGVSGLHTDEQALQSMLTGTGVAYRFTGDGVISLDLKQSQTSVDVTASVSALSTSIPKFPQTLQETPQTVNIVPQQVMKEQNVTTLRDALRNVSGISIAAGEGGAQGDNLTIRGFNARNDLFIDGMRDYGSYYRDPFNTEEVEVLQGPASMQFGRGTTGGVVNQASKTPRLDRFVAADAVFGTDTTRRATVDVNIPLPQLGSGAAFRLNAMGNIGNVAGRDVVTNRRDGIAPSLAIGLGSATRLTFSFLHQNTDDIPDYGIPWLFNGPAPVDRSNYYGFRDGNYLRTYADIGTIKLEHDVNSNVSLVNQVRYANYNRNVLISEGQILSPSLAAPLSSLNVRRNEIGVKSTETNLNDQLNVMAHFETGFLRHSLVSGVEGGSESSSPSRALYANVPVTSLLNPDPDQPFTATATPSTRTNVTSTTAAAYAFDSVNLGRKWMVTGGLRFDRFATDYAQTLGTVAAFHRVDNKPTWRAGLSYKPVPYGTLYFSSGTSFNPSAESFALSAGTANLPPESNRTYEFGTKWSFFQNKLSTTAAWFRTVKLNAREPDPANSTLNVLAGTQRVSGVQLDVRGRITSRWDMLAGYAYLDSRVVSSNYYPLAVGAQLANVPRHSFNMWNSFRLPWHTEFGAGGNYVSRRTASSTAPYDATTGLVKALPGYWVFNAMVSRPISEHMYVQANVYNIADRYYYDQLHPGHIVLGAGRSALIGIHFKF